MSNLSFASWPSLTKAINRARVSRHMGRGGAAYAGDDSFPRCSAGGPPIRPVRAKRRFASPNSMSKARASSVTSPRR